MSLYHEHADAHRAWRALKEDAAAVLRGLRARKKRLSPKWFYDRRGSELFRTISNLPEYYLTRTERGILQARLPAIARLVGPHAAVIEPGAGSNVKARQLLDHLEAPVAYLPVEISGEYLSGQAAELAAAFPSVKVIPIVADFTRPFMLPRHALAGSERSLVFFPGSTIGNFSRAEARRLLAQFGGVAGKGGSLLVGVDLVKDPRIIEPAYNDRMGVTAAFDLNALLHLNARLGADFEPRWFRHEAIYDRRRARIEMRLVAQRSHEVEIAGERISFARGEYIITEYSHKYTVEGFAELARRAGLRPTEVWVDERGLFSVHYLT